MPEPKPSEKVFLKILGGVQTGAEVSLAAGEYSLGSGADDDIQFIDVSMTPGHARLRVAPGKIEIRSGTGAVRTAAGFQSGGDEDSWQELQPLDVVTTGTTRFALGPPTAQWTTITEDAHSARPQGGAQKASAEDRAAGLFLKSRTLLISAGLLALVLLVTVSLLLFGQQGNLLLHGKQALSDVEATRAALDKFPFGTRIVVKQDVDGAIYATGYVDSNVERRAIVGAIASTGIKVRLRLGVLQVFRSELDGLIKAEHVNVTYVLSSEGRLTLEGTILAEKDADRFIVEVGENVIGLDAVVSKIKTAKVLLAEIEKLAILSQIDDSVVFRLDGSLIEANGVISVNKVDQWVGFLQAYSKRFGAEIGLRSYVQLEYDANAPVAQTRNNGKPILLGAALPSGLGNDLNVNRLKNGDFKMSELFAGVAKPANAKKGSPGPNSSPASNAARSATSPSHAPGSPLLGPIAARHAAPVQLAMQGSSLPAGLEAPGASDPPPPSSGRSSADKFSPRPAQTPIDPKAKLAETAQAQALVVVARHDVGEMTERAAALMARWTGGQLKSASGVGKDGKDGKARGANLEIALDTLANESLGLTSSPNNLSEAAKELFSHKYLPLFALARQSDADSLKQCRRGSRLSPDNLPAALFWLDLMSTTNVVTLTDFDMDAQGFILEAALNPALVTECLRRSPASAALIHTSIYLEEADRNPEFVRFVTRSLQPFSLDVTGASLSSPRFIQVRDGTKMGEGSAPDAGSRIDTVGELGVSVLLSGGFGTVIYGPNITWLSER